MKILIDPKSATPDMPVTDNSPKVDNDDPEVDQVEDDDSSPNLQGADDSQKEDKEFFQSHINCVILITVSSSVNVLVSTCFDVRALC